MSSGPTSPPYPCEDHKNQGESPPPLPWVVFEIVSSPAKPLIQHCVKTFTHSNENFNQLQLCAHMHEWVYIKLILISSKQAKATAI